MSDSVKEIIRSAKEAAKQVHREQVVPVLCRLGWHQYCKWEYVRTVNILAKQGDQHPCGREYVYSRKCLGCGKVHMRRVNG